MGNFDSVTADGSTQTRTHDQQNQITSISGAGAVTYDGNGNLTADGSGNSYVYDAWNRLVRVDVNGTTAASYKYDGLGRRITEIHGSDVRELCYSAEGQVLAEWYNGLLQARNVWSPVYVNALAYRDQARFNNGVLNDRILVQQDANWNVTALVNPSNLVLERYLYDPFGAVTVLSGEFRLRSTTSFAVPNMWQGMRYDWAVNLYITFSGRVVSPTLMRPLQMDYLGLIPDNNPYRWEGNGPTGTVDPTGFVPPDAPFGWFPGERRLDELRSPRTQKDILSYFERNIAATLPKATAQKIRNDLEQLFKLVNTAENNKLERDGCQRWVDRVLNPYKPTTPSLKVNTRAWRYPAGIPFTNHFLEHAAIRVVLPDNTVFYLDDGWWGNSDHIFGEGDVPLYVWVIQD